LIIPISEKGVQTSPIKISEKAIQVCNELMDKNIQTQGILNDETIKITQGETYSHSSKSIQTLFNKLEQSIQTMPNPDLVVHGEAPSIGKFIDPTFIRDIYNPYYYIDGYMFGNELINNITSLITG